MIKYVSAFTHTSSALYVRILIITNKAPSVAHMHRFMPNGEPAVYKLVTHLLTYPCGGLETVTPNSTVFYHIATGSSVTARDELF